MRTTKIDDICKHINNLSVRVDSQRNRIGSGLYTDDAFSGQASCLAFRSPWIKTCFKNAGQMKKTVPVNDVFVNW